MSNYNTILLEAMRSMQNYIMARPLNLGGVSGPLGGVGGPPGGIVGQLPQTAVAFDSSELAVNTIPNSGASLLDNLNRIRYRLAQVEGGTVTVSGVIYVQDEGTQVYEGSILNFVGAGVTATTQAGKAIITIPGGLTSVNDTDVIFTDNTTNNASTAKHGYLPKLSGDANNVLLGTGAWGGAVQTAIFTFEGELATNTGAIRIYNQTGITRTFLKVFLSVGTAPTGAAIIVDVNKNGSTIFSTQSNRPQIAASANTGFTTTFNTTTFADGEYITVDIDQVGSTVKGSNLTVHVVYR